MMEELSRYILSVIAASFLVAILGSLVDKKGNTGALFRLIGGMFLIFTMLSPIVRFDFSEISDFWEQYVFDGKQAAVSGEAMADEAYKTIIIDQAEAYILDKANELGADLAVEVTLNDADTPVPAEATLRGAVSPYVKSQLQQILSEDLGIAKEDQRWIG